MKRIISIIIFILIAVPCFADFCIVNQNNEVIGRSSYKPSESDLASRNEIVVECDSSISFTDVEYRGGKVVKHVKTQKEKDADIEAIEKQAEESIVNARIRKLAIDQLKSEGVSFKHIK